MTNYARVRTTLEVSTASDYTYPAPDLEASYTGTPLYSASITIPLTAAAWVSHDLAPYSSVALALVENLSTTSSAIVSWRNQKATKTFNADKLGFTAVAPCTVTDDDSTFVSTLHFAKGDYAYITNATEVANRGDFLVQAVAAGTLTMEEIVAFTLDADDAGTPTISCERQCEALIPASGYVLVRSPLVKNDLTFIAVTGTPTIRVSILAS